MNINEFKSFLPIDSLLLAIDQSPLIIKVSCIAGIILIASQIGRLIIKNGVFRLVRLIVSKQSPNFIKLLEEFNIFKHALNLAPILVIYFGLTFFITINSDLLDIVNNLVIIWLIATVFQLINAVLAVILYQIKQETNLNQTLIRTISQVLKIILVAMALIISISILFNKSPIVILSSLGALTAILLLVFKDSILGFVASIQVALLGIVKIGDWIEMPAYNADGDIIDINISTIKVQNFDKTITTIPTYAIVSEPVKNWRGMEEARCRRIKRSICIDVSTIQFCDNEWLESLKEINHIQSYINQKETVLHAHNQDQKNNLNPVNTRQLTNIGLFRVYLKEYIINHPNINNQATILIRQLQSSEKGLPIELYCFTNTTDWIEYEAIQSDIFDHIFSILHQFKLKAFQLPIITV